MKIDGKYVSGFEYRKKTLSKTLEIFEKLNSEEQINYIVNKIVTNGIGRRTGKLMYQTILGLMHPIVFAESAKNSFDAYGNYIGSIENLTTIKTIGVEHEDKSNLDKPNRSYYFSSIQFRNCLSAQVKEILDGDSDTQNNKVLYTIVKTMIECAFNTKSGYEQYDTTVYEPDGILTEAFAKRRYFQMDFFLHMRNKTIAELMNISTKTVTINTKCEEYFYDNNSDDDNKVSPENQEKTIKVAKVMCKNILKEIPIKDILNLFILDEDRIFRLDIELSHLINSDFREWKEIMNHTK